MEKSSFIAQDLQSYVNNHSLRLNESQSKLIDKSMKLSNSIMLGACDVAQFFQVILKATKAKKVLELGCFTGYTTMSMALALPDDGKIVTCDVSDKNIAFDIWREAGVAHKIVPKIGPGVDTLDKLLSDGEAGTFDFAFIDADKTNQLKYYEQCLKLVKKGGLIAVDNVLWGGIVANDKSTFDEITRKIDELNDFIKADNRVDISMLAIADGVTLCYVK